MIEPVKPNFLIIGAARSGTTALARTLAQHPDVFVTEPKEVHFLAHVDHRVTYRGPGDDQSINEPMITAPDHYHRLFAAAGGHIARGEGSVSTLYFADRSIPAIDKFADPAVRIVAVLREPAARAHSAYLYLRGRGFERLDNFAEALAQEQTRIESGYHHMWHLRAVSRYAQQLPMFADHFGDRLLVLIQEEYRAEPLLHLQKVARFLGVDHTFPFRTDLDINRGGEPRSRLVAQTLSAVRSVPAVASTLKAATPQRLRERIRSANLQAAPRLGDLSDLGDLGDFGDLWSEFEPDRIAVERVLGRPVPSWQGAAR